MRRLPWTLSLALLPACGTDTGSSDSASTGAATDDTGSTASTAASASESAGTIDPPTTTADSTGTTVGVLDSTTDPTDATPGSTTLATTEGPGDSTTGDSTTGDSTTGDTTTGDEPVEVPGELELAVKTLDEGWYQYYQGNVQYRPSGEVFALTLDLEGRPHVVNHSESGSPIYRAQTMGDAWVADDMFIEAAIGGYNLEDLAIGVDADAYAHIVLAGRHYVNYPTYHTSLHHAYTDGYKWFYAHPEPAAGNSTAVPKSADMAVDGAGVVHMIYAGEVPGGPDHERRPIYARFDGAWTYAELDDVLVTDHPRAVALALDDQDRPHLAYAYHREMGMGQDSEFILAHAYQQDDAWVTETAEDYLFVREFLALDVGPAGEVVIGYADDKDSSVWISERAGGTWTREKVEVDAAEDLGWGVSVAVDAWGRPHVAYVDRTQRHLHYARRSGGTWDLYDFDHTFSEGQDPPHVTRLSTELALDGAGRSHILVGGFDLDYVLLTDPTP